MTARHSNSFKVSVNTEPQAIVRLMFNFVDIVVSGLSVMKRIDSAILRKNGLYMIL